MRKWILGYVLAIILAAGIGGGGALLLTQLSPDEVLAQMTGNMDAVTTANITMSMDVSMDGQTEPIRIDGTGAMTADAFELNGTMEGPGISATIDEIIIGDRLYMRLDGGQWMYQQLDTDAFAEAGTGSSPKDFVEYLENVGEVEDLGSDELRGVSCYHLAVDVDEDAMAEAYVEQVGQDDPNIASMREMMASSELTIEIWVGKKDLMLYQEIVDMTTTVPAPMTMHAVIGFSDFGTDVEIIEPTGAIPLPQ